MRIKWLGHSCFMVTSESGVRVLTDPYNESIGYKALKLEADIVTTSHQHSDHNYTDAVKGDFVHISQPGKIEKHGITIEGIPVFHDKSGGSERGKNIVFCFDIDGIRVCHCGDLGHELSSEQVEKLGKIDVLLIPVGGYFTIDAEEALKLTKQLEPEIVIPMHYATEALGPIKQYIAGVDRFLASADVEPREYEELVLNRANLKDYEGIVLLKYE